MGLYFFHLVSSDDRILDEQGCEFESLEAAYLGASRAALELSFEMLRERRDPHALRFEICDEAQQFLMDLPFKEVLHPAPQAPPRKLIDIQASFARAKERHQTLRSELAVGVQAARETLASAYALLRHIG